MKSGALPATLMLIGGLSVWLEILSRPLGVREPLGLVSLFVGVALIWWSTLLSKKARGEQSPPIVEPDVEYRQRKRLFWTRSAALVAGSIAVLPLLPYIAENFQTRFYFYVVPAQLLFIGFVIFLLHRRLFGGGQKKGR